MRNLKARHIQKDSRLPHPVPGLTDLHRVREPGSELRAYVGLDRNERLAPLPSWFIESILRTVDTTVLAKYPVQDGFHRQLCDELQLPEAQVLLTAGSDAAIKAVYQAYIRPGDAVIMLDPSYAMYSIYAQIFQAEALPIPFDNTLRLDTKRLLKSIVPGIRIVMLANPNQPTGTLLEEDVVRKLLGRAADVGALVAIDEAYYPFARRTALPLMKEHAHLLIMRTFSKAAGLAGLRIGFAIGHPDVISNLYKVRSVCDVNAFAILCASQIIKHPQIITDYVDEVEAGTRVLAERVRALGLEPLPTNTNFMLIRVAHRCEPAQLVETLRSKGYLIKGAFSAPCLADCVRVTLGPADIMAGFAECLQDALDSLTAKSR